MYAVPPALDATCMFDMHLVSSQRMTALPHPQTGLLPHLAEGQTQAALLIWLDLRSCRGLSSLDTLVSKRAALAFRQDAAVVQG